MNPVPIAQFTARTIVAVVAAKFIGNSLNANTNANDTTVKVTSLVGGELVAQKLSPYTDSMVLDAVTRIQTARNTPSK